MIKYIVYNNSFKELILNIKEHFHASTSSIHKARNELKIIKYDGAAVVVKSFHTPSFIRRIIYTFLKDSKAKKSYENSKKIGDFTPKAIGYIEFFELGLISQSYFVAQRFEYDFTIREPLLDKDFRDRDKIFRAFAGFTCRLHQKGILHKDYSPGNILIKKDSSSYIFKVVDINRMEFRQIGLDEKLKSFAKLWASDEDLKIIIDEYCKSLKVDTDKCRIIALRASLEHKKRTNFKKRLRGKKVVD